MDCPVCLEQMENITLHNMEIDTCRYCGGVWLDPGELSGFIQKGKVPGRVMSGLSYDDSRKTVEEGNRKCPRCNTIMKVVEHKGVNVDVCDRCSGLWFDKGEIKSILLAYKQENRSSGRIHSEVQYGEIDDDAIFKLDFDGGMLGIIDTKKEEQVKPAGAANEVERELMAGGGKDNILKAAPESHSTIGLSGSSTGMSQGCAKIGPISGQCFSGMDGLSTPVSFGRHSGGGLADLMLDAFEFFVSSLSNR